MLKSILPNPLKSSILNGGKLKRIMTELKNKRDAYLIIAKLNSIEAKAML